MSLQNWRLDNDSLRLDSEYQLKGQLNAIETLRAFGATQFKDDAPEIIHPHEIVRDYVEEDGVWFLRAQNVRPLSIDPTNRVLISQDDATKLARNVIKRGDVLVTRTGANRGQCAFFDRSEIAIASSHTFIIRPKSIDAEFLTVFLNSSFGIKQIDKGVYGAAQPEVAPYYLRNIWIPNVGNDLVRLVKESYASSVTQIEIAEQKFRQAEIALLAALGRADWKPLEPLSYVASSADAFAVGRLDAQYFMPAKRMVREALSAMSGQALGQRFDSIREMFDPKSDNAPAFVRNYDVTDALQPILDDEKPPVATEEIGSMKKVFKDGDVAISRLRAYLREIAVVRTSGTLPSVGSSEFIVLRPRNKGGSRISPETLLTFLRSTPVQTILKWCQDGSQHPRFSESDLLSIHVPDAVADASPQIEAIVKQGFEARRRARELLDRAKRAVEIAIEDSEAAALRYLKEAGP